MSDKMTYYRAGASALPDAWIESLFKRLAETYGSRFADMWAGVDEESMKRRWAEKLAKFSTRALKAAADACDDIPRAPTLPDFILLCRQAESRFAANVQKLEAPAMDRDVAAKRAKEVAAVATKSRGYDFKRWAYDLKTRYQSGERLDKIQEDTAADALGEIWTKGQCFPSGRQGADYVAVE